MLVMDVYTTTYYIYQKRPTISQKRRWYISKETYLYTRLDVGPAYVSCKQRAGQAPKSFDVGISQKRPTTYQKRRW